MFGECGPVSGDAGVEGRVAGQAAEEDDPAVAGREQMAGDRACPGLVVELDDERRDVGIRRGPPAQDEPRAGRGERLRVVRDALPVGVVLDDPADQDHQSRPLLAHQLDELQLAPRVTARGADQTEPAAGGGLRLHALGDLGVEGTGDLAQDDGDHLAAAADQGAGVRVGDVVEVAGGAQHPGPGGRGHRVVAAEDARDRGHGHSGPLGHLADRDPPLRRHVVPHPHAHPPRLSFDRLRRLRCWRRSPSRTPRPFCRRPGRAISSRPRRARTAAGGPRRRR